MYFCHSQRRRKKLIWLGCPELLPCSGVFSSVVPSHHIKPSRPDAGLICCSSSAQTFCSPQSIPPAAVLPLRSRAPLAVDALLKRQCGKSQTKRRGRLQGAAGSAGLPFASSGPRLQLRQTNLCSLMSDATRPRRRHRQTDFSGVPDLISVA